MHPWRLSPADSTHDALPHRPMTLPSNLEKHAEEYSGEGRKPASCQSYFCPHRHESELTKVMAKQ
jgi:hypothetical protein